MDDKSDKPKKPWIYESPDKGVTVYRRPFGDYDTPREKIKDAGGWLVSEDQLPDAELTSEDVMEKSCTGC